MNWTWIPNLFYDLLGRIVPGGFVLGVSLLVIVGPSQLASKVADGTAQKTLVGFAPLAFAFISAYMVGVVLGELSSSSLSRLYRELRGYSSRADIEERFKHHLAIDKALGRARIDIDVDSLPGIYAMYGHLRSGAPAEASRLLKLRAEEQSCEVVALGSLILAIVNAFLLYQDASLERWLLLLVLLLTVYACLKHGQDMNEYFQRSTCSAWLILVSESRQASSSLASTDSASEKNPNVDKK